MASGGLLKSLVGVGLLLSSCGGPLVEAGSGAGPAPEVNLWVEPVPDASDPALRAGAASGFVDCVYGVFLGGWNGDFGFGEAASSPEGALARFLDRGPFDLPTEGYALTGEDTDRLLYTYSVAGAAKVSVIVADTDVTGTEADGWIAETFATCDPAEYDPASEPDLSIEVWRDEDDNRVPTSIIRSLRGAEHCGWQSATFLRFDDRDYLRDPRGVVDVPLVAAFDPDAELPADAVATGYHRAGQTLWLRNDGMVAYLVDDEQVEAWPAPVSNGPVLCA